VTEDLLWKEAVLVTTATDLRGQPADNKTEIDGHTVNQAVMTTKGACGGIAVAPAQITDRPAEGTTIPFRSNLVLRGTQSLSLLPYGQQIDLQLSAPWDTPSFTGSMLPLTYGIDHAGFHANWQIAGDAVSGNWHAALSPSPFCSGIGANDDAQMGVDLLERVPTYLMVSRAAKYGTLFLALSFLTYFIFEAVSRVRIHLAQYALLGLSVSLFALLLVALAEPLGFTVGYVLSTAAVMAQASLYTLSIVGSARLAAMFAGVLGLLFGFLYVVLSLETFSLLAGTVALFGALSAIMVMTRRVDWGARATASNGPVS
jgi:inner membrane protein